MSVSINGSAELSKRFNEVFEYRDGKMYWKISNTNAIKVGQEIGTENARGYRRVSIDGNTYAVHRVIWIMFYGELSKETQVDHINGDAADNRIENLRLANNSQNCCNRRMKPNNSGIKNVSFVKESQKYRVSLQVNKQRKFLGSYEDLELAELVALEARNKYHGEFARS
jgi:citrate synthase